jgi:hypothetical protein
MDSAAQINKVSPVSDKIFFHIGLQKTATTWFQNQLFPSLDGFQVLRTKRIEEITPPKAGGLTLIVSDGRLSGSLSTKKPPGTNSRILSESLDRIATLAGSRAAIIIGFREHRSWLRAAFSQKAKKWGGNPESYVKTLSLEDLTWCRTLSTIEASCASVFPFLYEELSRDPDALIDDLCLFLGTRRPSNLHHLVSVRENPSPKGRVGQLLSRSFFIVPSHKRVRNFGARLGARLDRYFPERPIAVDSGTVGALSEDWNALVGLVSARRGRDFSMLSRLVL